jgi:NAD-dependent DNA ligase
MAKKKEKIEHNSLWLIELYQVNYLVYSYLYYNLNESLIKDTEYDSICCRLVELMQDDKKLAKTTKYFNICKDLDESASGFYIKEYPQDIINIANTLLYRKEENK